MAPYRYIKVLSPPITMFHRSTGMLISCTNSFPSVLCVAESERLFLWEAIVWYLWESKGIHAAATDPAAEQ